MGRQGSRQAGFSIAEAVVVVALIGAIVATGWFVYQHNRTITGSNQTTQNTANQSKNQQSNTNPNGQNTNTNTFTIPELDAKLTLPEGLTPTDLKYSMSTATGVPTADFTTASLEQADGTDACRASQAPIGIIWRTTQNPASGSVTVKQLGQYYYAFEKPQGSCTGNTNAGKLEQSQTALLQQAFETITTIN